MHVSYTATVVPFPRARRPVAPEFPYATASAGALCGACMLRPGASMWECVSNSTKYLTLDLTLGKVR